MITTIFFDLGETLVTAPRKWLAGAKSLVANLKQNQIRLGIISNTDGAPDRQAILDLLPVDFDLGQFDQSLVLFSSEVGVSKPKRAIFDEAVAAAGGPAGQCLYCSENPVETLVAQAAGMRSLRIVTGSTDLQKLESFLSSTQANS